MLCEFTLPSNPERKVRLREATVADAIDFSSIDPDFEEEVTSLFLEKMQESATYSDPKTWTGEDRLYAMFMYHIHTTRHRAIPLTFKCSVCGQQHTSDISLAAILDSYTPMSGKAFREFPHDGHNVIVTPLTGADLELLEKYRYDLSFTEGELESSLDAAEVKKLTEEVRRKRVNMAMFRVLCCIDFPFLDEGGTRASRRAKVEEYVKAMPVESFKELFGRVEIALAEMRHGLRTVYKAGRVHIEIPDVKCDTDPNAPGVVLLYSFRPASIVPTI